MKKIGSVLKRKFGPLPFWAWAAIGGVLLYYYRSKKAAAAASTTTAATGAVTPPTPQPITTLQPGESAYDPNTGSLETAPGGGGTTTGNGGTGAGSGGGGLATALGAIATALGNLPTSATAGPTNNYYGTPSGKSGNKPAKLKTASGLPILTQLKDLRAGVIKKSQLGKVAKKDLASSGGNVGKAITARSATNTKTAQARKPSTAPHVPVSRPRTPAVTRSGGAVYKAPPKPAPKPVAKKKK